VSLLTLVRVLALVLGVQLSGASHVAADVMSLVTGTAQHDEQCPLNGPCDDCPSGCPNCHCPNALGSVAPLSGLPVVAALPSVVVATFWIENQAPSGPELPLPFRPPRTERSVS